MSRILDNPPPFFGCAVPATRPPVIPQEEPPGSLEWHLVCLLPHLLPPDDSADWHRGSINVHFCPLLPIRNRGRFTTLKCGRHEAFGLQPGRLEGVRPPFPSLHFSAELFPPPSEAVGTNLSTRLSGVLQ